MIAQSGDNINNKIFYKVFSQKITKYCLYFYIKIFTYFGNGAIIPYVGSRECRVLTKGGVFMKIKPLFDRIVIQEVQSQTKTASGLVLPDSAQEKPQMAKVLAVGPGGIIDGKEIVMQIKVGDKVLFNKYAGSQFKLDGEEVTILKQSDVLAIVEE